MTVSEPERVRSLKAGPAAIKAVPQFALRELLSVVLKESLRTRPEAHRTRAECNNTDAYTLPTVTVTSNSTAVF
jgi:hypothetical protein